MDEKTYRLDLQYKGGPFFGWQEQPDARTVEGELRTAYERFLGIPVFIDGSGRTDTGVHARHQIAVFRAETRVPPKALVHGIRPYLSEGVEVFRAAEVDPGWGPRPAHLREYRYFLWKEKRPPLFVREVAAGTDYSLDLDSMRRAAALIPGERDFSSFRASGCTANHPIRRVENVEVIDRGACWEFRILGNAFLRQMVRILVGTLVEIGRGEIEPEGMTTILEGKDRVLAGPTLPPQGLFLWKIDLEENETPFPIPPVMWETQA